MKTKLPGSQLLPALLAVSASAGLMAQSADPGEHSGHAHGGEHEHHEIEEIIVRATPLDRNLIEISQSATVLQGDSLQREAANNIGDTLSRLPGLASASFGQNVGRPVIRGLQGQRVGVLSNNMAASDASAVSQDHAVSVEPFLADQIEVLRGPSTLLYGSGAIGGVVNIVSHSIPLEVPADGFEGRALVQVDSAANQRFAAARIDTGASAFAFHADAFYRRTDDYEIPGEADLYPDSGHDHEEDETAGILANSFLDNEGGALGGSWIGERWRAGLSWTAYNSNYGIPGAGHHHEEAMVEGDDEEEEENEFVTVGLESRRWDAEIVGTRPFGGFEQLKFRFAGTDYTHTEYEGAETGTVFDSETEDARLELRHEPWGRWSGAFGLQYTGVDFSAFGEEAFVPSSRTESGALFWIESAEFDRTQLEFGLRYDDVEISVDQLIVPHELPGDVGAGSARRSFTPFSASLGAVWHFSEISHLAFTLARAERAPNAQELFSYGPHIASQTYEIGNQQLDKESNLHTEAAYRIHGGRLTGSIVVYLDRFDDFIYQQNTGEEKDGLPLRIWSQQDAEFFGAELELRYDLGHLESGHWELFGLADIVDGELDNGQNVPLMPPARFGLGLDWHRGNWFVNLAWIHALEHKDVADYETVTPAYDLLNAELSWHAASLQRLDLSVFLKARNLLDEDIRNSTSTLKDQAPQIGRNFILGVRVAF